MARLHSFITLFLVSIFSGCSARTPAHGRSTARATTVAPFTPYYVPPGAKSYDSSSPLIHYSGTWFTSYSKSYVGHSIAWSTAINASVTFTFTGTGLEWFGNVGKDHGIADVYVDGKFLQSVNTWSSVTRRQQRVFWEFNFPYGRHTLKIVNTGRTTGSAKATRLDLDAIVVTKGHTSRMRPARRQTTDAATAQLSSAAPGVVASPPGSSAWSLEQKGSTGVSAMQLVIISDTHALVIDKVEHNPLTISGHPAWAALYNLKTHAVMPLQMQSNSFCAGGAFLGNGTLINVGGNPVVADLASPSNFGDRNGLQAIRIFEPCDSASANDCAMYENHARIRMASPRWYPSVVTISDGSAMIIGGSKKGGWINNATVNNPTIEYFPPKAIHGSNGLPINSPFLADTLNSNLFPIVFALPDGTIFIAANQNATIYNWETNTERRLPSIPNGVRVTYPMTGTGLLLPLSPDDNYTPEVLLCGGSTISDQQPSYQISSQDTASAQCSRIVLTDSGISAGWSVEQMPQARIMPDAVLLPTGQVVIVNGAGTGISGYGNVMDQIGASNADNPTLTPVLYDPLAAPGERFSSSGMPTSAIPRMYHSTATLTPDGDIMIAGSNPNLDRSEIKYGTEYQVEWLKPPYLAMQRPAFGDGFPKTLGYGQVMKLDVTIPSSSTDIKVALMNLGYVTHAVHSNSRLVYLATSISADRKTLRVTGPPSGKIYPPGPGWLYLVVGGVPSPGRKVLIGDGRSPPVDRAAMNNMLKHTTVDQSEKSKTGGSG